MLTARSILSLLAALSLLPIASGCDVPHPDADGVGRQDELGERNGDPQAGLAPCTDPNKDAPSPAPRPEETTGRIPKRTRFGVAPQWYQKYDPPAEGPQNVDSVVVGDWLIENGFTDAHQQKLTSLIAKDKQPYLFGYILTALTKKALGEYADCDGDPNRKLCREGAEWVRAHAADTVVPMYREAARRIGSIVGTTETLIHMEPDYFQFSEKAQRTPLTREESNDVINSILGAIKEGCPSCKVVIDFSPWFASEKTKWATSAGDFYAGWDRSVVKYVGLTGKPFPYTEGKIDNFTYEEISKALDLPLVVIDAYTFGGGPIDVDRSWLDANTLAKATNMGIAWVFLSQQGDVAAFDAFAGSYRQQ